MKNTSATELLHSTITEWIHLYSDQMYSWTFYKVNNKETSEDLVQETFMAALHSFEQFKAQSDPKTWLFAILKHKIADHFRKVYRSPAINDGHHSGEVIDVSTRFFDEDDRWKTTQKPQSWSADEHLTDNPAFLECLHKCLDELPSDWNAAIQLKYLNGKKGEIICQELQISPTNFWQIIHRAKLQLRKCLENKWFKR